MNSGMGGKMGPGGGGGYPGSSRHSSSGPMPSTIPSSYHPPSGRGYSGSSGGYHRNESPASHPGSSHYPPHGERSGSSGPGGPGGPGGYYKGRPSTENTGMRPRGSGEGYYSQPRHEFNRGGYNNYSQPLAPRTAMYHPPSHSVDKGPYAPPSSYRPQYPKPMGMMNRYNPPMDKMSMREPRPRRNTRWETPISKQEISTFFAQYATFILSAKAFHSNLNSSKDKPKMMYHDDKKEMMYNSAPAITPHVREPQMSVYYDESKSHMHMGMGGGMMPPSGSNTIRDQDLMGNSQPSMDYGSQN